MIGYSKDQQTQNSSGGKGPMSQRRQKVNSREKGCRGEREFIDFVKKLMGLTREDGDRRNYQFQIGGGSSNPDVQIKSLPSIHHEVKNCNEFDIPEWQRQVLKDCPPDKIPCLAIKIPPHVRQCRTVKWWVFIPKVHLFRFAAEWQEALRETEIGYVDPFPYPMEAETFHFAGYLRKKHVPGQFIERDGWIGMDMHDLPPLVTVWAGRVA